MCFFGPVKEVREVPADKPLTGYRVLERRSNRKLYSWAFGTSTPWRKNKPRRSNRKPRRYGDMHGLHVFRRLGDCRKWARENAFFDSKPVLVKVRFWGTVVEHYTGPDPDKYAGYRAHYMQIVEVLKG